MNVPLLPASQVQPQRKERYTFDEAKSLVPRSHLSALWTLQQKRGKYISPIDPAKDPERYISAKDLENLRRVSEQDAEVVAQRFKQRRAVEAAGAVTSGKRGIARQVHSGAFEKPKKAPTPELRTYPSAKKPRDTSREREYAGRPAWMPAEVVAQRRQDVKALGERLEREEKAKVEARAAALGPEEAARRVKQDEYYREREQTAQEAVQGALGNSVLGAIAGGVVATPARLARYVNGLIFPQPEMTNADKVATVAGIASELYGGGSLADVTNLTRAGFRALVKARRPQIVSSLIKDGATKKEAIAQADALAKAADGIEETVFAEAAAVVKETKKKPVNKGGKPPQVTGPSLGDDAAPFTTRTPQEAGEIRTPVEPTAEQIVPSTGAAPEPSTTSVSPLPETQGAKGLVDETQPASDLTQSAVQPTLTPEAPKRPVPPSAEPHRLETLSPEPNPEGVTMGRRIIWNGKGRDFINRDFEEAYDLIDSGLNDVRRLEREAAKATDAETKRAILSEAGAIRKGVIEAKTELFEYMDSLTGRVDPDLDAEFAMRVAGEDMTERTARVASRAKQMGGTRLPVGDLRELFSDLRHLAGAALQAGQKYGAWVSGLVKQAGKQIIPYAKRAWERASNAIRNANATRPKGTLQAGGFGRAKAPKVDLPEHLRTAEEPKGVMRSPWRWLKATLGAETEAADLATKDLGKRLGKDLTNTNLDIRSAINTQTRLHPKVDDAVMKGIRGPDGERITMGLPDFIDGLRRDGIDPDLWQGYRRALREMDLADRGGIPDDRMAANTAVVDDFLGTHGDAVARWDAEWQKIADAQLDLYEQYGLKPPGWAAKIREENPFYYPLVRAGTDVERTMGALNPQPGLASPMGKVIRAIGGNQYQDGFASMAAQTERLITEGEKNLALLPFMDEMSKQADQTWVREITDLADGEDLGDMPDLFGQPKKLKEGDDPILTLYENGKPRRFEVDPYIWKAIQGLNPQEFNAVQTVLRAAAQPARFFTTGKGNPLFGLIFNPMIDITSGVLNHGLNPLRAAQGFWHALLAKFGKETKLWKDVIESNVLFGQGNTKDFVEARRYFDPSNRKALDKEMQSLGVRALHKVDEIYSAMRDSIEEGTRVGMFAQQKAAGIRKGLDPKAANKQASQIAADLFNFGEPSTLGRTLSGLGVPYANIVSQAAMSAARGFKRSPSKFMARMGLLMTAPALWEYQTYKDDKEWKALPDYVKMGGMTFRTGTFTGNPQEGSWVSLRVPAELGVIFRGIPMRALEAMESGEYGESVKDELYSMSDQWTPSFMPTLIAAAGQASFYFGSGATPDLRFFSFRSYPVDEDSSDTAKAKAAYKQIRQQADTLLGSMGRMAAQGVAHAIDREIEPKAPSLLQRYRPQPGQYLQDTKGGASKSASKSIGQSAAKKAARLP